MWLQQQVILQKIQIHQLQQVPLKPEAELHLLVGSAYGEGDTESP